MSTVSFWTAGALTFYDPAKKHLWTRRESRYQWHEDFDTYSSIPDDGSRANGNPWVQDITGAAPPTVTLVADAPGGVVQCALTSASQAQDATIHFDDNRHVDLSRNAVFQAYARLTALPTGNGIAHLGLASDHAASFVGTTYNAGFTIAASGAVSINLDDDTAPLAIPTGFNVTLNEWHAFRVEAFDLARLRFYIDGHYLGQTSATPYTATGANAVLQPFVGIGKASGTGVGTLQVDSVDIWQD